MRASSLVLAASSMSALQPAGRGRLERRVLSSRP